MSARSSESVQSRRKQEPKRRPKMGKPKLRVISAPSGPKDPENTPQNREYFASLHKIIDDIFQEAADTYEYTWSQLASHADLAYGTVERLGERITKYPHFRTVYKLAQAVGWTLVTQALKKKKQGATAKVKAAAG